MTRFPQNYVMTSQNETEKICKSLFQGRILQCREKRRLLFFPNTYFFIAMNNRLKQLLDIYRDEPDDAFTRYAIALEYNARKEYQAAQDWFERLRADEPEYVPTYYMLAGVYRATDEPQKALEIYRAGLQAAKKAGDAHALSELAAALEELEEELE